MAPGEGFEPSRPSTVSREKKLPWVTDLAGLLPTRLGYPGIKCDSAPNGGYNLPLRFIETRSRPRDPMSTQRRGLGCSLPGLARFAS